MELLEAIANAFIMTFGITPPKPERRRAAAIFIGGSLFCVVVGIAGLFVTAIAQFLQR